jgi:hypothetical protein
MKQLLLDNNGRFVSPYQEFLKHPVNPTYMQGFLSVRVIPNRRGTIWLKQIGLLGKGYLSKILTLVSSYTVEKFLRSNCGQMTVITRTNLSHLPVRPQSFHGQIQVRYPFCACFIEFFVFNSSPYH